MHDYYVNSRFRFGIIPEFDVWLAPPIYVGRQDDPQWIWNHALWKCGPRSYKNVLVSAYMQSDQGISRIILNAKVYDLLQYAALLAYQEIRQGLLN